MEDINLNLSSLRKNKVIGRVISSSGSSIIAELPLAGIGDIVTIELAHTNLLAEVVGFSDNKVNLAPFSEFKGLMPGAKVISNSSKEELYLSENIVGSLTDAYGNIINPSSQNKNEIKLSGLYPLEIPKAELTQRTPISEPLWTGVKSIDTFTTLGKGQKILLLAEPGVGKSSLLNSLCQNIHADLVVVALIGERGREVIEFYEELKATGGDKKTIVVSSTSDSSPLLKRRGAITAIRIAEVARDRGMNVFLAFDSLTRYVRALRDVSLSAGEIPVRRGYPASVFEEIPKYIERAGNFKTGSISAIYTMLSSGEIEDDPLVEEVKGYTDGHIILSKKLAEQGVYPALNINQSLSRISNRFFSKEDLETIERTRSIYSTLNEDRELLALGGSTSEMMTVSNKLSIVNNYLKHLETGDINIPKLISSLKDTLATLGN